MLKSVKPKLLLLLFLLSCETSPKKPKNIFHVIAPNQLYFKNVRSIYYKTETDKATKIDYYTLNKWNEKSLKPALVPVIADNWIEEEAYLQLNFKNITADSYNVNIEKWENINLPTQAKMSNQQAYELALAIKNQLLANELVVVNDSIILFEDRNERSYFLTTLQDYLRLIEKK